MMSENLKYYLTILKTFLRKEIKTFLSNFLQLNVLTSRFF